MALKVESFHDFFSCLFRIAQEQLATTTSSFEHHRCPPLQVEIAVTGDKRANCVGHAPVRPMIKMDSFGGSSDSEGIPANRSIGDNCDNLIRQLLLRVPSDVVSQKCIQQRSQ